jgi:hypothetical protein
MEKSKTTNPIDGGGPGGRGFLNRHRNILAGACLAFGAVTSGGCAIAPAVMLTTAAVSAVAVVSEGERLILNVSEPNSVIVKNDAAIYTGPGEGYSRKGTLDKGDKIEVLGYQEGWVQCRSDQFEMGWIHDSDVPDI